jgi:hypothetical protein
VQSLARVSRVNVLTAIRDHDQQGASAFLETLGFDGPGDEILLVRGKRYPARALLAYAHGKATGEYLGPDQLSSAALGVLRDLDFDVVSREDLDRPRAAKVARTRTPGTAARTPRAAASTARTRPEPVVRLCPTCFTQLSVTGTCDFCE